MRFWSDAYFVLMETDDTQELRNGMGNADAYICADYLLQQLTGGYGVMTAYGLKARSVVMLHAPNWHEMRGRETDRLFQTVDLERETPVQMLWLTIHSHACTILGCVGKQRHKSYEETESRSGADVRRFGVWGEDEILTMRRAGVPHNDGLALFGIGITFTWPCLHSCYMPLMSLQTLSRASSTSTYSHTNSFPSPVPFSYSSP